MTAKTRSSECGSAVVCVVLALCRRHLSAASRRRGSAAACGCAQRGGRERRQQPTGQNMTMGMGFMPMPGMFGSATPSATDAAALGMTRSEGGMMGGGHATTCS